MLLFIFPNRERAITIFLKTSNVPLKSLVTQLVWTPNKGANRAITKLWFELVTQSFTDVAKFGIIL